MPAPRRTVHKDNHPAVTAMAAAGLNIAQIASRLEMREDALRTALAKDPHLKMAFDIGRAEEENQLVDSLSVQANDPSNPRSVQAATFLLKTRHGYRDRDEVKTEVNIQNNSLSLNFPKPLTGAKLERLVAEYTPALTPQPAGVAAHSESSVKSTPILADCPITPEERFK